MLSCGATANVNWDIDIEGDLPTACPSEFLVSVTATNDEDLRTFSAYGLIHVDLGAPGSNVYTLSGNGYNNTSGTSFASPLTAGIIALLYSAPCSNIGQQALSDPQGAALLIRDYLYNGVDQTPQLLLETATGGRANAHNSLQLILQNCGSCPVPYSLNASGIVDTSATLSWFVTDSILYSDLRYRLAGDTTWTLVSNVSSPYELTGLLGCHDYEFQVEGICGDTTTGSSNSYAFSTLGCCFAPENININPVSSDEIFINWDSTYGALGYVVNYKTQTSTEWSTQVVSTSSISFGGLLDCTIYQFEIATVCTPDSTSVFSETFTYTMECACEIPENIDTLNVQLETATIKWDATANADNYIVRFRRFGLIDWEIYSTSDLNLTVDSLLICTFYQFQVQTICPISNSAFSPITIFKTDCLVNNNEVEKIWDVFVHPNPAVDQLFVSIDLPEGNEVGIEVFNTFGQLVTKEVFGFVPQGQNQLRVENIDSWPAGMYFVKIQAGTQFVLKKVVKN